ncbi:MAG: 50S ribosomal protein L4 [Patescibacteria group bacterium]|nr:50S ribosomal protein L4 [Patescibacteria group bacterium]
MKIDVYNQQNEKISEIELPGIFSVKWNSDLVHQALTAQMANSREPWAHIKTRGDVRGGGKKPWRQKGTGKARHGSIRSPLWIGGGVTHGPLKEKDYSKKINKKMLKLAVFSLFSKKIKDNEIKIVDKFEGIGNKTKEWANVLKNLADLRLKTLVILENRKKENVKNISNIKNADTLSPTSLNIYDLIKHKNIIIESGAIPEMEKHYKII